MILLPIVTPINLISKGKIVSKLLLKIKYFKGMPNSSIYLFNRWYMVTCKYKLFSKIVKWNL